MLTVFLIRSYAKEPDILLEWFICIGQSHHLQSIMAL